VLWTFCFFLCLYITGLWPQDHHVG
jgi:hypothetical protein